MPNPLCEHVKKVEGFPEEGSPEDLLRIFWGSFEEGGITRANSLNEERPNVERQMHLQCPRECRKIGNTVKL